MESRPEIRNSNINDLSTIFEIYQMASDLMKSKNQVAWPKFDEQVIIKEINELRQWKLLINNQIACIWATTLNDELIWGNEHDTTALYIHRIASHPNFRGQRMLKQIVRWADEHCLEKGLQYVRLDTVGFNKGLINVYTKNGFSFLGIKKLENTKDLAQHYSEGPVCLFQRTPMTFYGMNYDNRSFRPIKNSENGETSEDTVFEYKQSGNILTCSYSGGQIRQGHLIGLVDENGHIEMRYHQVNLNGELKAGICNSKPEFLEDGKIRLHENWEWTSGNHSKGKSILEEL